MKTYEVDEYLSQQPTRTLMLWLEDWDRIGKRDQKGRDVLPIDRGDSRSRGLISKDDIRQELDRRSPIEHILGWSGSRRRFWRLVHNVVAHPLLETGTDWSVRFHDWTGDLAWSKG